MSRSWVYEHSIGSLAISAEQLGTHLVVCISGGNAPHIGSVVLSESRPSLTGSGKSATSSVLNRLGHKDEVIARVVSDRLAAHLDTVVCCICGIHKDNATPKDIRSCETLGEEVARFLLEHLMDQNETPDMPLIDPTIPTDPDRS